MAGHGPAPKENAARRNAQPEKTRIVAGDEPMGWDLPEGVLPDGEDWNEMTRRWWASWQTSPQASRMLSDPDWFFLLDTALMHHVMWSKGRWEFAAEIRLRVAKFGATPEDRLRLRQEIEVPDNTPVGQVSTPEVADIAERRKRIRSA